MHRLRNEPVRVGPELEGRDSRAWRSESTPSQEAGVTREVCGCSRDERTTGWGPRGKGLDRRTPADTRACASAGGRGSGEWSIRKSGGGGARWHRREAAQRRGWRGPPPSQAACSPCVSTSLWLSPPRGLLGSGVSVLASGFRYCPPGSDPKGPVGIYAKPNRISMFRGVRRWSGTDKIVCCSTS